jgi:hypothetical protein
MRGVTDAMSGFVSKGLKDSARLRKAFVAAWFLARSGLMPRARQSVATAAWGFKSIRKSTALKGW